MKKGMVLAGVLAVASFLASGLARSQNVPALVNYQGRLTDSSGQPVNGSRQMRFVVYDGETSPTALWSETQTVSVANGIYNVLLGSVNPITSSVFGGADRWLEVRVEGETLSPRQRITSVPYALSCDLGFLLSNRDFDNDGHQSPLFGGDDCNDFDSSIYPGAPEITGDGIDQSCDGYPFGPDDMCGFLISCGINFGSVEGCVSELGVFYQTNLMSVDNLVNCLEGATCGDINTCMADYLTDVSDELCGYLSGCGYLDYFQCTNEINQNPDLSFTALAVSAACLQEGATCSTSAVNECLVNEEFEYEASLQMPWGNEGYSIEVDAEVFFSSSTDSYAIRNPRGDVYPLSYDIGWLWHYSQWFNDFNELTRAWPSGEYAVLRNGSTIETFTVPTYDQTDFPKGFAGVSPPTESTVSENPLTIEWQLAIPGYADPVAIELHMHNWTRGGDEETGEMSPTATSGQVPIPAGTQTNDELAADLVSFGREYNYLDPLDKWFSRKFRYRYSPHYYWGGP